MDNKLTKQLAIQTKEVLLDGHWISTNFKEQLEDVDWQMATTKIGSLNTIAALAFHINYYVAGVNNVFRGGTLDIKDKFSFDLAPISSTEDWEQLKSKFYLDAEELSDHIDRMNDEMMFEGFAGGKYGTNIRNVIGQVEHAYYHLGQIVIIKKLIKEGFAT